jgi:hypothetical protein
VQSVATIQKVLSEFESLFGLKAILRSVLYSVLWAFQI